jgi:hypothetical protein
MSIDLPAVFRAAGDLEQAILNPKDSVRRKVVARWLNKAQARVEATGAFRGNHLQVVSENLFDEAVVDAYVDRLLLRLRPKTGTRGMGPAVPWLEGAENLPAATQALLSRLAKQLLSTPTCEYLKNGPDRDELLDLLEKVRALNAPPNGKPRRRGPKHDPRDEEGFWRALHFDVELNSDERIARRNGIDAPFKGRRTLWNLFVYLIDQKAHREWETVVKEINKINPSAGFENYSDYGRAACCRLNKIIKPLGLWAHRLPAKKGAVRIEELPRRKMKR